MFYLDILRASFVSDGATYGIRNSMRSTYVYLSRCRYGVSYRLFQTFRCADSMEAVGSRPPLECYLLRPRTPAFNIEPQSRDVARTSVSSLVSVSFMVSTDIPVQKEARCIPLFLPLCPLLFALLDPHQNASEAHHPYCGIYRRQGINCLSVQSEAESADFDCKGVQVGIQSQGLGEVSHL